MLSLTYSLNHCFIIFNMMMLLMIHFKIFWIIYLFGIACSYKFNWLLLLSPPPSLSLKCIWLYASSQQFTCFIYTIFSTTISIFTFSKAEQKIKISSQDFIRWGGMTEQSSYKCLKFIYSIYVHIYEYWDTSLLS